MSKDHQAKLTYHVDRHDGGWAYRLDDVWSEPYSTHQSALDAAKRAAQRQHLEGRDTEILFQTGDGEWHKEQVRGDDRPNIEVVDG